MIKYKLADVIQFNRLSLILNIIINQILQFAEITYYFILILVLKLTKLSILLFSNYYVIILRILGTYKIDLKESLRKDEVIS